MLHLSKILTGFCSHTKSFADDDSLIFAVIYNGYDHKFSFGHENLFTSAMGFAQTNACLPGSINAENHGHSPDGN